MHAVKQASEAVDVIQHTFEIWHVRRLLLRGAQLLGRAVFAKELGGIQAVNQATVQPRLATASAAKHGDFHTSHTSMVNNFTRLRLPRCRFVCREQRQVWQGYKRPHNAKLRGSHRGELGID